MADPITTSAQPAVSPEILETAGMILSKSDIIRIRAEERLRAQLREELKTKDPKKGPFIEFLNSAFGLLIVSGLLISGIGKFASVQYENIQSAKQIKKEAVRYSIELGQRIYLMDVWIKRLEKSTTQQEKNYNSNGIVGVNEASDGWYPPIYEEFKRVPIQALLTWFKLNLLDEKLTDQAIVKVQGLIHNENNLIDANYAKSCTSILKALQKQIGMEIKD